MAHAAPADLVAHPTRTDARKPHLSLLRIVEMNLGFLGLQFSFGLQQGNMVPIYSWLGADEASLPILQLAGPMTGLLIQPLVGAMSDRTDSRFGRRTPYFLIGAILCSLGLFLMPHSSSLLMAASLLWLLDAGNNTTMEPYRAYVSDRLNADQHELGFLSQSAFTGLAQCMAFLSPSILVYWFGVDRNAVDAHNIPTITHISFLIGAVLSICTILWSVLRVPELPTTPDERERIAASEKTAGAALREIVQAIVEMPRAMRQMAWMSLFQWYGFSIYWSYAALSIGRSAFGTADKTSALFRDAVLTTQQLGAFYNLIGFAAAFAMVPLARRFGASRMHMVALMLCALSLLMLPGVGPGSAHAPAIFTTLAMPELGSHLALMIPALGLGLGWASIMGNPYVILARAIPAERTGVYMGIFNMMIVLPMLINGLTFGWIYRHVLNADPRHAISFAALLLFCAGLTMIRVRDIPEGNRRAA
ncbi:MFS transporter [Novosphingobium sp. SG707]|uniref:MFS transporter n=1 Tax=Novosphingobium sp. SG707 TaxID=2586996 RepID=UPI001806EAF1|nr:MFS transporter [Novosphingobium sp. SG707]NKJ01768.1 maltose/moltooligosaccharide transporter [Novosphingobium sp. SG707]